MNDRMNWLAAAQLSRALVASIAAVEDQLKSVGELSETQKATQQYWAAQVLECEQALTQLKELARHTDHIMWDAIKAAGKGNG